ncbi:hypothetical protein QDY65_05565 [Pyrococcus kukulkanii]|uniref:hypothetical protein n=1 Tax=Pyrococcus kukulkanii TaxID=1609559 RepID=UPI00356ADFDB
MALDGQQVDLANLMPMGDRKVSLFELENQGILLGLLDISSSRTLPISWEIDPNVDNGIQGDLPIG